MKVLYVNKLKFPDNTPGSVFSTFNSYGFAQNGADSVFAAIKKDRTDYDNILKEYFGVEPLPNFEVKLFSKSFLGHETNEYFYLRIVLWLLKDQKKERFEAVITRDPGFLPYLIFLKKKLGISAYYQSHNFYTDLKLRPDLKIKKKKRYHNFETRYIPQLNGLICLQKAQEELYKKYYNIPVKALPPGLIAVDRYQKEDFNKRLIYIGSFQPIKGIDNVFKLLSTIKNQNWSCDLLGGRNKEELEYTEKLAEKFGVREQCSISGWLSYSELQHKMKNADIGLLLLNDTFYNNYLTAPSKLFDYIAQGIPVIATDLPDLRCFIKDGKEGFLLKPDNLQKAAEILNEFTKSEFLQMRNKCYKLAEENTWKKSTARMLEFIKKTKCP